MKLNASTRQIVYAVLLAVSVITAIAIVAGAITEGQVLSVIDLAKSVFAGFASVLALINLSPDA